MKIKEEFVLKTIFSCFRFSGKRTSQKMSDILSCRRVFHVFPKKKNHGKFINKMKTGNTLTFSVKYFIIEI